ncbi:hypothetical protein Tco_0557351 [Tanacetum coccineum]
MEIDERPVLPLAASHLAYAYVTLDREERRGGGVVVPGLRRLIHDGHQGQPEVGRLGLTLLVGGDRAFVTSVSRSTTLGEVVVGIVGPLVPVPEYEAVLAFTNLESMSVELSRSLIKVALGKLVVDSRKVDTHGFDEIWFLDFVSEIIP